MCYLPTVRLNRCLSRLLAALWVFALVAAPLARPAVAVVPAPTAVGQTATAMPADMPCCPDEVPDGCAKDCPWVALCFAGSLHALVPRTGLVIPLKLIGAIAHDDAVDLDSFAERPPPRPPKT